MSEAYAKKRERADHSPWALTARSADRRTAAIIAARILGEDADYADASQPTQAQAQGSQSFQAASIFRGVIGKKKAGAYGGVSRGVLSLWLPLCSFLLLRLLEAGRDEKARCLHTPRAYSAQSLQSSALSKHASTLK